MAEAEPIYHCDSCGYALARVYSPVGVSFKGKGFYSTDNRQLQLGSSSLDVVATTPAAVAAVIAPLEETTMS